MISPESLETMKWPVIVSSLLGILAVLSPQPGQATTTLEADAVGHAAWIQTADSSTTFNNDPGFATPLANLRAESTFDGGLTAFAELYFASHDGSGDAIEIGSFYGSTGTYFPGYTVTAGKFQVDFGLQSTYRSDHAQVQKNPLIGNPLIDPTDHQVGLSLTVPRFFGELSAAVTNGSADNNLNSDRGYGSSLKLTTHPFAGSTLSVSGYRSYHADTTTNSPAGTVTTDNLFGPGADTDRDPIGPLETLQEVNVEPYSSIDRGLGSRPDVLTIGRDFTAWQVDLLVSPGSIEHLRGSVGKIRDDLSNLGGSFSNKSSTVKWTYYTAETKLPLSNRLYLAGRWNKAEANRLADVPILGDGTSNGSVERYQLGLGYRISNNLLVKSEYVNSREDVTKDRIEYEGLSVEVSITGYPRIDQMNLSASNGDRE